MKRSVLTATALSVVMAVALSACSTETPSDSTTTVGGVDPSLTAPPPELRIGDPDPEICGGETYRIGLDFYGSGPTFGKDVLDGARAIESELGCVELIVLEDNVEAQTVQANVESLVAQKVDGIALLNVVAPAQERAVQTALSAGIPIATAALSSDTAPFIDVNMYDAGYQVGGAAAAAFQERYPDDTPYVFLGNYPESGLPATDRFTGAREAIDEAFGGLPEDRIIEFDSKHDVVVATQTLASLLSRVPEGAPIITGGWFDEMGFGMMKLARESGHDVVGFGFGGDSNGRKLVCDPDYITSGWAPEDTFRYFFPALIGMAQGHDLPASIYTPTYVLSAETVADRYPEITCG